ncbi:MAG TPA: pilus assembly protein [Gemmobacter sp.]|nr:pilus assembly protein [Gemmobacter sp.]HBU14224.1 pilus assembly protein [Gemmobacter sp.]
MIRKIRLPRPLRRFLGDETGSMIVEAVLVMPMMAWAAFALFVYWDAYATINRVQKATYTVADVLSRSRTNIDSTDAFGVERLFNFTLPGDTAVRMRLTSAVFSDRNNRFEVQWSCALDPVNMPALTTATLQQFSDRLPLTADADTLMIVETQYDFTPIFDVGLNDMTLGQFVATRPRFIPAVGFTDPGNCR